MIVNRCVFIKNIGRCHVISTDKWKLRSKRGRFDVAPMDAPNKTEEFRMGMIAADILAGYPCGHGQILWSVRFKENAAA